MLKCIIRKEILDNLLSLRLSFTLILMVIIMTMSALLFISEHEEAGSVYAMYLRENRKTLAGRFESSEMPWTLWNVLSHDDQWVYKKPSEFAFLADGHDKDLPNAFRVNPFRIRGPSTKLRMNPFLRPFEALDWLLVIGVIMSFAAIVLTFDAVSGDRERGTLKLSMSNPVSRATILLGKFIGAIVSLLIPLLVGMVLNLTIIAASGAIPMDSVTWIRIGMASFFSLLYVVGFVSLGIFVSSITRESATSLVILLLLWAILTVVVPGVIGITTSRSVAALSSAKRRSELINAYEQARDEYVAAHPHMRGITISYGRWSPGESLAGYLAVGEAMGRINDQYMDASVRQVVAGWNITRISPLGLYRHAVETMAGTGISHHASFIKQVKRYRETLKGIMIDKYPLDPHKHYHEVEDVRSAMETVDFRLSHIPEFHDSPITVEEAAKVAIWDVLFLSLFSLLFLIGSVAAFLRYDVR